MWFRRKIKENEDEASDEMTDQAATVRQTRRPAFSHSSANATAADIYNTPNMLKFPSRSRNKRRRNNVH